MLAPDLPALLNFAANFRLAAVTVAQANGLQNVWTELQTGNKNTGSTGRVEVFFVLGDPTGHKTPLPNLTPKAYPHDAYNARLTWSVISNRDTNGATHEANCATIRAIMVQFRQNFTAAVLPYYEINGCIPQQNVEAVEKGTNLDVTQLPYALRFSINSTAWPVFAPAG